MATATRWTWDDVKARSRQTDHHFFTDKTMQAFKSRLNGSPVMIGGKVYGVVSSQMDGPRFYDVVQFDPETGETTRAHPINDPYGPKNPLRFWTRSQAMRILDRFDRGILIPEGYVWY